jgi:transposase
MTVAQLFPESSGQKEAAHLRQIGPAPRLKAPNSGRIVKRAADAAGFQLLPRRWIVERTFAWLNRNRRLAKDFEASIASAKAWVYIASVQLRSGPRSAG